MTSQNKMFHLKASSVRWSAGQPGPVIRPGQLHGALDARRAGAAHVLRMGERYRLYYWATGEDGRHRICAAESDPKTPNEWLSLGCVLECQPESVYNHVGPGFPMVVTPPSGPWLMYFGAWGKPRADGKLPNTTGLALSYECGRTWEHWSDRPVLPLDRPYDREGTGSVWVLQEDGLFRMYNTAIGQYFARPEGVRTGHGDVIPRIGIGYATSRDGIRWEKPFDHLLIAPRGFDTAPYEYICSKACVVREKDGYRMWVNTFGTAYRVRELWSCDGLDWHWLPDGPDGVLGVGPDGAFDDHQRCYLSVLKEGDEYRGWFTGNGFGASGTGYAVGTL